MRSIESMTAPTTSKRKPREGICRVCNQLVPIKRGGLFAKHMRTQGVTLQKFATACEGSEQPAGIAPAKPKPRSRNECEDTRGGPTPGIRIRCTRLEGHKGAHRDMYGVEWVDISHLKGPRLLLDVQTTAALIRSVLELTSEDREAMEYVLRCALRLKATIGARSFEDSKDSAGQLEHGVAAFERLLQVTR